MNRATIPSLAVALVLLICPAAMAATEFRLLSGDAEGEPRGESATLGDLSPDGTKVLFSVLPPQSGVAPGITEGGLYRRDLVEDTLDFVGDNTVAHPGVLESSISNDGRYIAWSTSPAAGGINHIYWRDTQTGTSVLVTDGADGKSRRPLLSDDGRYVAFLSEARNLVADAAKLPAMGRAAVYRYDSQMGVLDAISLTSTGVGLSTGVSATAINNGSVLDFDFSRDGKFLVFGSDATNVTPESTGAVWIYRRNLTSGAVEIVNRTEGGVIAPATYTAPSISDDGSHIAFIGSFIGVFGTKISEEIPSSFGNEAIAKDLASEKVWWVSRTLDGMPLSAALGSLVVRPVLSGNDKVVAMTAVSKNLVEDDVFPPAGTNDSFDIYRVELAPDGMVATSHVNRPVDDSAVNVGLRSDGALPSDAAYIAYATSDADVALDFIAPSTLAEQQVVGVGDFSGLGGETVVCGDADGDGVVRANDALLALRTAVGAASCPGSRCDANGDGVVRTGDALSVLRVAIGIALELSCPSP